MERREVYNDGTTSIVRTESDGGRLGFEIHFRPIKGQKPKVHHYTPEQAIGFMHGLGMTDAEVRSAL